MGRMSKSARECTCVCLQEAMCEGSTGWLQVIFFFQFSINSLGYLSNKGKIHSSGLVNKRALCGVYLSIF